MYSAKWNRCVPVRATWRSSASAACAARVAQGRERQGEQGRVVLRCPASVADRDLGDRPRAVLSGGTRATASAFSRVSVASDA